MNQELSESKKEALQFNTTQLYGLSRSKRIQEWFLFESIMNNGDVRTHKKLKMKAIFDEYQNIMKEHQTSLERALAQDVIDIGPVFIHDFTDEEKS